LQNETFTATILLEEKIMRSRNIYYLPVVTGLALGLLVFYSAAAPGLAGQSLLIGGEHVDFAGDCCANDPSSNSCQSGDQDGYRNCAGTTIQVVSAGTDGTATCEPGDPPYPVNQADQQNSRFCGNMCNMTCTPP
jgi:hypothetical protein